MKGHKPAKLHPWRQYKACTKKPEEDKIYSGYASEGKSYKLPIKRGHNRMVKIMLLIVLFATPVFAYTDGGSYQDTLETGFNKHELVRKEPVIQVDRHVLAASDYQNDPSILIAKSNPSVKAVEPVVITKVVKEPVYVVRDSEPNVTVTYEAD